MKAVERNTEKKPSTIRIMEESIGSVGAVGHISGTKLFKANCADLTRADFRQN